MTHTERTKNQSCLHAHLDAERRHDMDATLATLHPECVFEDMPLGMRWDGRGGARQHYDMWWSAFGATPERGALHWVDDDFVIGESAFVGRHVGVFAGVQPTDRPVRLPFVVFVRFRDGLLSGERFLSDLSGLLRELGRPPVQIGVPGREVRGNTNAPTIAVVERAADLIRADRGSVQ
jgi:ketosteroid isomerase-like protein